MKKVDINQYVTLRNIRILSIIGVLVFWVVMVLIMPSGDEIARMERKKVAADEYVGLVVAKYIDTKEHGYKTLEIDNGHEIQKIRFIRDTSRLYNYLQIGDSIYKPSGTMKVTVERHNSISDFLIKIPIKSE